MLTPRRSLLGFFLGATTLACSGARSKLAQSAPVTRRPGQQIPADLDVVMRLDLARVRRKLDTTIAEAFARLLVSPVDDPGDVLVQGISCSERIWLGLRPDLDPRRWDNVIILEGDFASVPTDAIAAAFGPSRDLGGGYKVYDAAAHATRTSPSRLYTLHEDRWLIASEAEVDALERVVERGHAERTQEPPVKGLLSVAGRLGRLAEVSQKNQKLRAFESARGFDASFDVSDGEILLLSRVRFREEADAERAHLALRLLATLALPEGIEWEAQTAGEYLSVEARAPLGYLHSLF